MHTRSYRQRSKTVDPLQFALAVQQGIICGIWQTSETCYVVIFADGDIFVQELLVIILWRVNLFSR